MYAQLLICLCITALHTMQPVQASTQILYWTKNYTSDLQWTIYPKDESTWEEVSGGNFLNEGNVRTYQICNKEGSPSSETEDHWLRSPFIETIDGKTIKLDLEFTIIKCEEGLQKCKETFNLFYYEAIDDKVASSTFPPWRPGEPYKKIDTVAAKVYNKVDNETYQIGPIDSKRKGIHLAIQDHGACISLISIRVYYVYCREQVSDLARFPRTLSGPNEGDLIAARGECVENAVMTDGAPMYHCNSVGEWKIQQGKCECKPGYHRQGNSCLPCRAGTYRSQEADNCVPCPGNSGKVDNNRASQAVENCPCNAGYARARNENHTTPCTKPPSQPSNLTAFNVTERRVDLAWVGSDDSGGRDDLDYNITCLQFDEDKFRTWRECPKTIKYRMDAVNECSVFRLQPYTKYRFKVTAVNGASWSMPCRSISNCKQQEVDVQTKESKPGLVDNISTSRRGPTSITFAWPKPSEPNGRILGYEAKVLSGNGQIVTVQNVVEPQLTVTSLHPSSPYQLRVRARTSAGYGPPSVEMVTQTAKAEVDTSKIVMIVAAASFVVAIVLVVMFICYKRTGKLLCLSLSPNTKKRPEEKPGSGQATDEQIGLIVDLPPRNSERIYVEYKDPQQAIEKLHTIIQPNEIKVDEIIGTGEFAEVCSALLRRNGKTEKVAAKRLKSDTTNQDRLNFLREAATLAQFNDPNIVQLKGVVLSSSGTMIVTEYMDNKSLDQHLRLHKSDLLLIDLLKMQHGVASGMKYLANMKYVHRDLAARNILIDSKHCCKVSDFGLSRVLQNEESATYTTQGGKIAIRWTAPECIRYRSFTSASDVWSFGIVVWEIMSGGEKPYWDMTNDNVYINVQEGLRLPSPMDCPKALHDLMLDCWAATPARRPTFPDLVRRIDRFIRGPETLRTSSPAPAAVNSTTSFAHQATGQELGDTPSLSRAIGQGQVHSVQTWLELQRLGNYRDQFEKCGIDSLEKVSNLTINDLKKLGISVTFHINRLENGIRTLKRHMSTTGSGGGGGGGGGTSPGLMMRSLSDASTAIVDNDSVFITTAKDVEAGRA